MNNSDIDTVDQPVKLWQRILTVLILQIFLMVSIDQASAAPTYLPATCDQTEADTCVDATPCESFNGALLCLSTVLLPLADGTPAPPLPPGATVVPETCWNYAAQFSCLDSVKPDSCAPLTAKGCAQVGSSCETDSTGALMTMQNGTCTAYTQVYQCQTSPASSSTVQNCSGASVCASGTCWSTASTPDTDFASAVTQMEIVRQASVYQGADMRIFGGDPESCTTGYGGLRSCCTGSGGGQSNGSTLKSTAQQVGFSAAWYYAKPLAIQGSDYVEDFMFGPDGFQNWATSGAQAMFSGASEYLGMNGIGAAALAGGDGAAIYGSAGYGEAASTASNNVLSGAGLSSSDVAAINSDGGYGAYTASQGDGAAASGGYGAYGITYGSSVGASAGATTVAADGTTVGFSGSMASEGAGTVISGGGTLGGPLVSLGDGFAFDPVSLGIMIAIMIIMAMVSCTAAEATLQMHKGSNLCTFVGSYCSTKLVGVCSVTTQAYCCYNSILARIINEQGRPQIGKGYGNPESPDCSGFTVAQIQQLNFGSMDLSAFTNTIVPNLPNMPDITGIQQTVGAKQSTVTTNNLAPPMGN